MQKVKEPIGHIVLVMATALVIGILFYVKSSYERQLSNANQIRNYQPTNEQIELSLRNHKNHPPSFTIDTPSIVFASEQKSVGLYKFHTHEITFSGSIKGNAERVIVTYTPLLGSEDNKDIYELQQFNPGDSGWTYTASINYGNLSENSAIYDFEIYYLDGTVLRKTVVVSSRDLIGNFNSSTVELLKVHWYEGPVPYLFNDQTNGEYNKKNFEKLLFSSFAPSSITSDFALKLAELANLLETHLSVRANAGHRKFYAVGHVNGGIYDGMQIFMASESLISDDPESAKYVMQLPNGELVRLTKDTSAATASMRWLRGVKVDLEKKEVSSSKKASKSTFRHVPFPSRNVSSFYVK